MSNSGVALGAVAAPSIPDRRLGVATWVIAVARFMVVLDGAIMMVAVPSIERSLHMSGSSLAWVINAYLLTFGGLMLVAGRVGDMLGRRNVFRFGLALFGLASLLGGLAPNGTALILFRGLQGIGAAVAAPGALSLLVATFPAGRARTRAFGLYGAVSGMAAVSGLLLGGVLTTYAGWRWVLLVNVPIAIGVLLGVGALTEGELKASKIDLPGAVTATLGVGALLFAVTRVGEHTWNDRIVIGGLTVGLIQLIAFVIIQRASTTPMIPAGMLNERGRAGANVVTFITAAGTFATLYLLTLYMQQVAGYTPLRTGLMFLPFAVSMGISAGGLAPQLLNRASERVALTIPLVLAAGGMLWFSSITAESSIYAVLIPASLVTGLGLGASQVVATTIGVRGIDSAEAGVGSSLLTAGSQVGGALGLALAATAASTVSRQSSMNGMTPGDALTAGYAVAFMIAAGLYVLSLMIGLITIRPMKQQQA